MKNKEDIVFTILVVVFMIIGAPAWAWILISLPYFGAKLINWANGSKPSSAKTKRVTVYINNKERK